jgi:predicted O-methyltransferase YrrM
MISDRISVLELAAQENLQGVVVEVGVAGGHFTKQILATWPTCSRLYAVDCWGAFDGNHLSDNQQEQRFLEVTRDLSRHKNVTIVRQYSHAAAATMPDESVDFIYIDADHSYAAALLDLKSWFPKLKKRGIMAGHDYYNGSGIGVKSAVDEFCAENNLDVRATTAVNSRESAIYGPSWEGPSFWFRRP